MPKITNVIRRYLVVEVDAGCLSTSDVPSLDRCNDVAREIKRHVDDIKSVYVEKEEEEVCQFCGYRWTEPDLYYNNGCCAEDEKGNPYAEGQGEAEEGAAPLV